MKPKKRDYKKEFLNTLCKLMYKRKFKKAEDILLDFIEKTLYFSKNSNQIIDKKSICLNIYYSFNELYSSYLKANNIKIKQECKKIKSNKHPNYLIANCTKIAEMDDLLFNLINYLDSTVEKDEVVYELDCYKKKSV